MQNQKINPEGAYQTILIVWASLLTSQFLFVLMVFIIKPEVFKFDFTKPLLGENALIIIALAAISVALIGISFVLRKKQLDQSVAEQSVGLVQTAMITGCALCEAISLFGLFLAISFSYKYFFLFSALGIFGAILHFPRGESVQAASYKK